jgi:ketosteroid isomerase-like protein
MKTFKLLLALMMFITSSAVLAQSKSEMPFSGSREANKLLRKSWVALADFSIEEGNNYTRQVLAQDPDIGMAHASLFTQNIEEQKENIRRAEEGKLSGDERMFIQGVKARLNKQSPQQYFDPLVKKYPKDLYLQLWIMFNFDDPIRATEIGEAIMKRNPKFAPVYNLLGYLSMNKNDMATAESYFNKYIALHPNVANPYDSKADYFMRIGKYEDAIPLYEKALAMGMSQSAPKIERAKAMLKYPKPSEEEISTIKQMMETRFQAVTSHNVDAILKNYSQQAVEIFNNQRVNVGLPNITRRMIELPKYGSHLKADFTMGSVYGTGPIAVAYGKTDGIWRPVHTGKEEQQKMNAIFLFRKVPDSNWKILVTHFYQSQDNGQSQNADDKESINQLLLDWEGTIMKGIDVTERLSALYSPQAIEIFGSQISNVGLANLKARWAQFEGSKTIRNSLGSMGLEVIGRRAVAWGIANQNLYGKDSDKLLEFEFPWAMILTKEKDDVWRILAIHWGAD